MLALNALLLLLFFTSKVDFISEIELNLHAAIKQGVGHESSSFTPSSAPMRVGWNELLIKAQCSYAALC